VLIRQEREIGNLLVDVRVLGHVEGIDGDITPWDPVSDNVVVVRRAFFDWRGQDGGDGKGHGQR